MEFLSSLPAHVFYIIMVAAFALCLPPVVWDPANDAFMFVVGGIALWRYSWALINWVRFHLYTYRTFPRWRAQTHALGADALPEHVYLLVTSFRIDMETTRRVYHSVVAEALHYATAHGKAVTIVASLVERGDQFVIKQIVESYALPASVKVIFVRIAGTGKRDALACGFRSISRQFPPEDAVVAVIDGDSMLPANCIAECASFFKVLPKLGALTTDEVCEVAGAWKFREWYNMRFAQRHIFMASVALSRRVLTLTGRMSMFRADIVCDPEFIERVEMDWVDHWRLGRFKFLTGDDKSSWFDVLKGGHEMIYVSDVQVITIETPPDPSFVKSSLVLMRRWFGNMLRTNDRAMKLGWRTCNFFPWLSIVDQRLSMWTSLTGLVAALIAAVAFSPIYLLYYAWWMLFTRYIITLSLLAGRKRVSVSYPFFLYYNQIVGSLVKTYVLFRLDKQRWTRQNTTLNMGGAGMRARLKNASGLAMQMLAYGVFITLLATLMGVLSLPDISYWGWRITG
jgi:glycosyltransferase Alg8